MNNEHRKAVTWIQIAGNPDSLVPFDVAMENVIAKLGSETRAFSKDATEPGDWPMPLNNNVHQTRDTLQGRSNDSWPKEQRQRSSKCWIHRGLPIGIDLKFAITFGESSLSYNLIR
jgi:hypothetical protein